MAGAGRAVIRSLGPGHRQALQQFFPVVPPPSAALMQLKEAGEESAESKDTQCHLLDHPENHFLCPVPWSRQTVLLLSAIEKKILPVSSGQYLTLLEIYK